MLPVIFSRTRYAKCSLFCDAEAAFSSAATNFNPSAEIKRRLQEIKEEHLF